MDRYKVRLVVKGYTQTYDIDYFETFLPVADELYQDSVLITINLSWPLFQMDVKSAFLYGDLQEEVCMEQPPSYIT